MTDTNTKKSNKITFSNGAIYEGDVIRKMLFGIIPYRKIPDGEGKLIWKDGDTYEGDFKNGRINGTGKFVWSDGDIYEGNYINGVKTGEGRFTVVNEETREPLYTEIYDENGIMESVEYLFEDQDNRYRMTINYDGINRALNAGNINLGDYIKLYDENGVEIEDYDIIQLVRQCAKYQMQAKLRGKSGKLDDESKIDGGYTGLQNLIVLAEVIDNFETLKKIRFEIKQNSPYWPADNYKDVELWLNSVYLTAVNPPKSDKLTYIGTLIERDGIDYLCTNMITTAKNHEIFSMFDLPKIIQFLSKEKKLSKTEKLNNFIYSYDSSRVISVIPDKAGDLGGLQPNCQFYNSNQQDRGSCYLNACCSAIIAAENEKIFNGINKEEILPVKRPSLFERFLRRLGIIKFTHEFNYFEIQQILKLQEVAKDLGVERFGKDNKRMIHQIVNEPTREAIKIWANNYFREHENLNCLENRLNTYESLLVIGYNEGLGVNELGPKARQILSERTGAINEERILVNEDEIMRSKKGGIFNKILVGLMRTFRIFRKSSILRNEESNKKLIETNKELTNVFRKATERNQILLDEENKQLNLLNRDIEIRTPLERTK